MQLGTVITYFPDRGFGFLKLDRGGDDLFFHIRHVERQRELEAGARVQFEIGTDSRTGRLEAKSVCAAEDVS